MEPRPRAGQRGCWPRITQEVEGLWFNLGLLRAVIPGVAWELRSLGPELKPDVPLGTIVSDIPWHYGERKRERQS